MNNTGYTRPKGGGLTLSSTWRKFLPLFVALALILGMFGGMSVANAADEAQQAAAAQEVSADTSEESTEPVEAVEADVAEAVAEEPVAVEPAEAEAPATADSQAAAVEPSAEDASADESAVADLPEAPVGEDAAAAATNESREARVAPMQATGSIGEGTGGTVLIPGQKVWVDAEGLTLPASVTFELYRGDTLVDTATATADTGWQFSFDITNQPIAGAEYRVAEVSVTGFTSTVTQPEVTFTPPAAGDWTRYTPGNNTTIDLNLVGTEHGVVVMKKGNTWAVWTGDRLSTVEAEAILEAMKGGIGQGFEGTVHAWIYGPGYYQGFSVEAGNAIHFDGSSAWSMVWAGAYDRGSAEARQTVVTNTPTKLDIPVTKVWNDENDQAGFRPDAVSVVLTADGTAVGEPRELNESNGWTTTFEGLPTHSGGTEIAYSVQELAVANYTVAITGDADAGFTVTNTHEPTYVDVDVTKVWNDANNQDGKRPGSITLNLFANGEAYGEAVTVAADADGNWGYTFTNLPEYMNGEKVAYTVTENAVPGYEAPVVTGDAEAGYVVTNTYTPEVIDIDVTKVWDDANNQDGKRPASITVNLLADGVPVATAEVTADGGWAHTFTELPKYRDAGVEIVYTVTEDAVEGYNTSITNYTITNSYTPELVDIPVTKVWDDANNQDGKRPESITVNLLADGTEVDEAVITEAEDGTWTYTFTGKPKYEAGTEIVYTITEDPVEGYETSIVVYEVTNSYTPETLTVTGMKTWNDADNQDGKRPASIQVQLLADGVAVGEPVTVTAGEDGSWAYEFTDLPRYRDGGTAIVYTVAEVTVPEGYTSTVNGMYVTNSYTPEVVDIDVTKAWDDANDQDGKRPDSVEVQLYADGVAVGEPVTVTADSNWAYSFTELPMYRDGGVEIVYTVAEVNVPEGYTSTVDGMNVTNSYTPEVVDIDVTKVWDDANDQDGKRPDSITVQLIADDEVINTAELTADGNWQHTFKELAKYRDGGIEIVYTVEETNVPEGYESSVLDYTITNSYTPETMEIPVVKVWKDKDSDDRPDSIKVNLLANGEKVATLEIDEDDDWKDAFTDLPVYAKGEKITYTLTEEAVKGYTSEVAGNADDGFTVTNTVIPAKPTPTPDKPIAEKDAPLPKTGATVAGLAGLATMLIAAGALALRRREA